MCLNPLKNQPKNFLKYVFKRLKKTQTVLLNSVVNSIILDYKLHYHGDLEIVLVQHGYNETRY